MGNPPLYTSRLQPCYFELLNILYSFISFLALQISLSAEEDSSLQKEFQFNQTDIEFRQVFRITNEGPSPQNEPFEFSAFVPMPETDMIELRDSREYMHVHTF